MKQILTDMELNNKTVLKVFVKVILGQTLVIVWLDTTRWCLGDLEPQFTHVEMG